MNGNIENQVVVGEPESLQNVVGQLRSAIENMPEICFAEVDVDYIAKAAATCQTS